MTGDFPINGGAGGVYYGGGSGGYGGSGGWAPDYWHPYPYYPSPIYYYVPTPIVDFGLKEEMAALRSEVEKLRKTLESKKRK